MMAIGKHPFYTSEENEVAMVENIQEKPLDISYIKSRDIDSDCKDLIIRMLEKERRKRITFEEIINHPYVNISLGDEEAQTEMVTDDKGLNKAAKGEEAKGEDCSCHTLTKTNIESIIDEKEHLKYCNLISQHEESVQKEHQDKIRRFITKINRSFTEAIVLNTTIELLNRCESHFEAKAKEAKAKEPILFKAEELLEILVLLIKFAITKRNKGYYILNGYDPEFIFTNTQLDIIKELKEFKAVKNTTTKQLKKIDENFTQVLNWMGRVKKKYPEKVPRELEKIAEAGMESLSFELSLSIRLSNCLKKIAVKIDKSIH